MQEWSVNGISGGNSQFGTITSTGVYRAPAVPPTPNQVFVMALGSGFNASGTINVVNPTPITTTISPAIVVQRTKDASLTVKGTNFTRQSQVYVDGELAATKFVSATSLQATLPASVLQTPGIRNIIVQTPQPGGGASTTLPLTVMANGTVSASNHPLVALYDIQTPVDGSVAIDFGVDTSYGRSTSAVASPVGGGPVEVQVAGMLAATTYHMRAHVTFSNGTTLLDEDHTFTTGVIPPDRVPKVTVTHFAGGSPSPGIELLSLLHFSGNQYQASATDLNGNLIWFYDVPEGTSTLLVKPAPNGHFAVLLLSPDGVTTLREIDLAGNTIRQITNNDLTKALASTQSPLTITSLHHDVLFLANGHWILLANVTKQVNGLDGYSVPVPVWGDVLIDLDANFNPVWTWSAFDHLDPNRHLQGLPDWTHSNAVIYTSNDGNLLLSLRHQSWIVKIDYANGRGSGAILWRLGDEGDFTLTRGDRSAWQYAQHYPRIVSIEGSRMRLGVMDNGNLRMDANGVPCGTNGGAACYSRLAVFDIDEQSRTVTPAWEYRPGFYSFWGGTIEFLGNGDVEGAFSAAVPLPGLGSRIVEVTNGDNPQPVWQLDVAGESAYRGFRLPSLYPGVQW